MIRIGTKMLPNNAMTAPGTPRIRHPICTAMFAAKIPGIVCDKVIMSKNSSPVSQRCRSTNSFSISGIMA